MATIQHRDIPEAQLHEPKGVSTASAGDAYIANGSGSGSWATADALGSGAAAAGSLLISDGSGGLDFTRYQGWGQYQDTDRTVGTPTLTLTAGVKTKLTCDGGYLTVEKLPSDATASLWNTTTNKIQPVAAFDMYHVRVGFWAENYAGINPYIDFALDIGSPIGEIAWRDIGLRKSGATVKASVAFPVFAGDTFLANGGEFYLTYNGTGTCDIYAVNILAVRESKNYV